MEDKKFIIILIIIIVLLGALFISKTVGGYIVSNILMYIPMYIWILGIQLFPDIIGVLISIIIILLIRKKLNKKSKNFKTIIYVIVIIVCVLVSRILGYTIIVYLSEKPDKVYSEMKELNDNEELIGLTKSEVIKLLGEPSNPNDNCYIYDAGTLTNYLFFGEREFYDLFIWFDENGIVKSTKIDLPRGG